MTLTIVSGGQTGVEQGAIEAAINLALTWRGWASRDYIAGLSAIYRTGLEPTSATDQGMVRRLNCQEAHGALVFSTSMVLVGVPAFVDRVTEGWGRAFLHITLNPAALQAPLPDEVRDHIRNWIRSNELARVYVTGPSADAVPGIQGAVRDALIAILEPFAIDEVRETTRVLGLIEQAQPDPLADLARSAHAIGGTPTHIAINPANVDAAIAAGLDVQIVPMDPPTDPRYSREHSDTEALTWQPPMACPPEGLDALQRRQLDASIREAERDIRAPHPLDEFLLSIECCPRPPAKDDIDRLTDEFYKLEGNGAGGSLHVVLDDGNWERECVEFCRKWASDRDDVAGVRFAELLLTLTDEQLHEYLGAGYCGRCGVDYGDEHARNDLVQQTFPPGQCPECGSDPAQPPASGDPTV